MANTGGLVVREVASVAVTAGTPATVWTPASGRKFRLVGWSLGVTVAAAGIIFKEGAGNAALAQPTRTPVLAINGLSEVRLPDTGVQSSTVDNPLKVDVTANATVTGVVYGFED